MNDSRHWKFCRTFFQSLELLAAAGLALSAAGAPTPLTRAGPPDTWRATLDETGISGFEIRRSNEWLRVPFCDGGQAGPCWQVQEDGRWQDVALQAADPTNAVYEAMRGAVRFAIRYETIGARLAIIASMRNESAQPTAPLQAAIRLGIDTAMAGRPDWESVCCPTLLGNEPTHAWACFRAPDGRALGVTCPDPTAGWMQDAGTAPRLLLLQAQALAANEMKVWTIQLEDLPDPATDLPRLSAGCRGPIAERFPDVAEPGGVQALRVFSLSPVSGSVRMDERDLPLAFQGTAPGEWRALVGLPSNASPVVATVRDAAGRMARATLLSRPLWSKLVEANPGADAPGPVVAPEIRRLLDDCARLAQAALEEDKPAAKRALADRALEISARLQCLPRGQRADAQFARGLWLLYRLTGRGEFLRQSWDLAAENVSVVREIALTRAYVIERANRDFVTYNCQASAAGNTITVTPLEPCITSLHVLLRSPATVQATLAGKPVARRVERSAWLGDAPSP